MPGLEGLPQNLSVVVTIPCYRESLAVIHPVLEALACQETFSGFSLVLILVNTHHHDSGGVREASLELFRQLVRLCGDLTSKEIEFRPFFKTFEDKKSGVGHARKFLMDMAFHAFLRAGHDGVITCLDADTLPDRNYLKEVIRFFDQNDKVEAASVYFEHVLDQNRAEIIQYELHLRYFINMQRWLGLPFAYQTIGSAMAVKAYAYAKEGGMNKRQAGEDFYFLHKFTKNGTLGEINMTVVRPSGRISDRVPFGTGKAVSDLIDNGTAELCTYNPKSFLVLRPLLLQLHDLYNCKELVIRDSGVREYLSSLNFLQKIEETRLHTSSFLNFQKRFYTWFNAFALMKYLHNMRSIYPDIAISEGLTFLFAALDLKHLDNQLDDLLALRMRDRVSGYGATE